MLETDEVDDDFFTPVAGTSLANIFGNVTNKKEGSQNDSLKYVPPKPQNIVPKKREETKHSECIYACTVSGHEWYNNVYIARGSIGLAIVKIIKTGEHNIILYDSNKTTLSCAIISTKLEVTIKNNSYICYYDSHQKYWSIYGSQDKVKKISEMLTTWGVNVNHSAYTDKGPPEPNTEIEADASIDDSEQQNIESDTDSSVNKKTKASILNRMAHMGHSVLPTRAPQAEISSDSSDAVENIKTARHKPVKNCSKKTNVENIVTEHQNLTEDHQKIITATTESDKHVAVYSSQLIPLTNTSVIAGNSSEFGMFMSEQRISNSEIRININRITDKMDLVLNKINNLEHKEKDTNVSTDIMLKLLTEYENKIKVYEEMLKSRNNGDKVGISAATINSKNNDNVELLKNKIIELKKENENKINEISNLQKEIRILNNNNSEENQIQASKINEMLMKITTLENELQVKDKEITDLKTSTNTKVSKDSIEDKVKNIMNDTFQTISLNFESNENYSGETIRRIIGTVIKKITIQTLSEL